MDTELKEANPKELLGKTITKINRDSENDMSFTCSDSITYYAFGIESCSYRTNFNNFISRVVEIVEKKITPDLSPNQQVKGCVNAQVNDLFCYEFITYDGHLNIKWLDKVKFYRK